MEIKPKNKLKDKLEALELSKKDEERAMKVITYLVETANLFPNKGKAPIDSFVNISEKQGKRLVTARGWQPMKQKLIDSGIVYPLTVEREDEDGNKRTVSPYSAGSFAMSYKLERELFEDFEVEEEEENSILINDGFRLDLTEVMPTFHKLREEKEWGVTATKAQMTRLRGFEHGTVSECDKTGRQSNPFNRMNGEFRKHLTCKGEKVVEVDLQSSQINIIAAKIATGDEQRKLKALLGVGFYKRVAAKLNMTIKEAKIDVVKYLGGGFSKFEKGIMKVYFPETAKKIKLMRDPNERGAVTNYLCRVEADIVRHVIKGLKIPNKSIHDGILVRESDAEYVKGLLIERAKEIIGFEIIVSVK